MTLTLLLRPASLLNRLRYYGILVTSGLVEDDDGESESEEEAIQRKDRPQHNRQRPGTTS